MMFHPVSRYMEKGHVTDFHLMTTWPGLEVCGISVNLSKSMIFTIMHNNLLKDVVCKKTKFP